MERKTRMRGVACALLLALLAVCGYIGAGREQTQTVSAAVTRLTLPEQTQDDAQDAAEKQVRLWYVIEAIAAEEKLEAKDDERGKKVVELILANAK